MLNDCPCTAIVLSDAYHSASIEDSISELFREWRRKLIAIPGNQDQIVTAFCQAISSDGADAGGSAGYKSCVFSVFHHVFL
jgi:hypothetical protein